MNRFKVFKKIFLFLAAFTALTGFSIEASAGPAALPVEDPARIDELETRLNQVRNRIQYTEIAIEAVESDLEAARASRYARCTHVCAAGNGDCRQLYQECVRRNNDRAIREIGRLEAQLERLQAAVEEDRLEERNILMQLGWAYVVRGARDISNRFAAKGDNPDGTFRAPGNEGDNPDGTLGRQRDEHRGAKSSGDQAKQ